jgi:hypothetical protein
VVRTLNVSLMLFCVFAFSGCFQGELDIISSIISSNDSTSNNDGGGPNIYPSFPNVQYSSNQTAVFSGNTAPSATVTLRDGGACSGTVLEAPVTADAIGNFSIVHFFLTDGSYSLSLEVTNGTSTRCHSFSFTLDRVPPSAGISIAEAPLTHTSTITIIPSTMTDIAQIQIGNSCGSGTWTGALANNTYTLSGGIGGHTVFISFRDLAGNTSACMSATIIFEEVTVEARSSVAPNWNDYFSSANMNQVCNFVTSDHNKMCVHGGELRKVVTTHTSCAGLSLTDDLALFDWGCSIENGFATFTSRLRPNIGLADLGSAQLLVSME